MSKRSRKVHRTRNELTHLYKHKSQASGLCFYCGAMATGVDHVPPICHASLFIGAEGVDFDLVSACLDCNRTAGIVLHINKDDRKVYIYKKLLKKNAKLLTMPNWKEEELAEMNGYLKKQILSAIRKKSYLLERLAWFEKTIEPWPLT
jgi:hypothetical protein